MDHAGEFFVLRSFIRAHSCAETHKINKCEKQAFKEKTNYNLYADFDHFLESDNSYKDGKIVFGLKTLLLEEQKCYYVHSLLT